MSESLELEDCVIPLAKQGAVAQAVFGRHSATCEPADEMSQAEFEAAMTELGVANFQADRDGAHDVFVKDNQAITRTKYGSLRFARDKTRRCTDVPCLLLYIGCCVGMFFVAKMGFARGDPNRLLFATNYQGEVCGRGNHSETPLIYFPELEKEMVAWAMEVAINPKKASFSTFRPPGKCVAACPKKGAVFDMDGTAFKVHFEQREIMMRCFSKYPASPLYFAKCKEFHTNASTRAASDGRLLPREGTCTQYKEEWRVPSTEGLCSALTGDFRSVTCLTKAEPCDSLMRTYYDADECCDAAMRTVYPRCASHVLGSGNFNENPLMNNPVFQKMMAASAALGRAFGDMARAGALILLCGGLGTMLQVRRAPPCPAAGHHC